MLTSRAERYAPVRIRHRAEMLIIGLDALIPVSIRPPIVADRLQCLRERDSHRRRIPGFARQRRDVACEETWFYPVHQEVSLTGQHLDLLHSDEMIGLLALNVLTVRLIGSDLGFLLLVRGRLLAYLDG
jgi:hypothetical protein